MVRGTTRPGSADEIAVDIVQPVGSVLGQPAGPNAAALLLPAPLRPLQLQAG